MISFSEYMNSNPGISGKKIETENPKDNVNESRVKNALEKVNEIANEIMEVLEPIQKSKVETVQESERVEHVEPVNEGYLLYRDKPENFTCDIAIEGAKLNQSEARIIIESEDWNLVFPGKIIGGKCTVPMKKLSLFEEGCKGDRGPLNDITNYQWKPGTDKPEEAYKDFCDCIRYMALEQPVYEPPSEKLDLIAQLLAARNETDYHPLQHGLRMA